MRLGLRCIPLVTLCALKLEWIKKSALEETMSKRIGVVFPHTVDEEIFR